ncbi:hypothetical protein AAZV13_16G083400 [Glycine max]
MFPTPFPAGNALLRRLLSFRACLCKTYPKPKHWVMPTKCRYCDYKICSFNRPLFHFGRRYARFLKVWFSIGVGFALSAVLGVTLVLLWELARTLHLCAGSNKLGSFARSLLFGIPPSVPGLSLSLADTGYACVSTIISVFMHELGHAVAATSEGIQVEYIAVFIAILFPGALVAFNYEFLQTLPHLTALRVYSAGIWHNAVRSGNLGVINRMKGYCVPSFMMDESKITELLENQHACPSELTAFVKSLCSANVTLDDGQSETDLLNRGWNMYCLNAKDVVKRYRCGDDWGLAITKGGGCTCSQDEFCLAPVQEPGSVWVEIAYSRTSHECLSHVQNRFPFSETSGVKETNCGGTFIFVGDVISMAHSIQLTSYQPRWGPQIVAYFPNLLERILIWTFHVSLALALLNGLPVYFLDGESILDATLSHFTSLSPGKRKKVLRLCLLGGSVISIIVCFRELL